MTDLALPEQPPTAAQTPAGEALIEAVRDPENPCRVAYRITAASAGPVQDEIDRLTNSVDGLFDNPTGRARFIGPRREDGEWVALGEVEVFADQNQGAAT